MSNRFEAMTDEDFDHAFAMYRASLARRDLETKGWKRLAFDLIRAAGGTQRVSMLTVLQAHTDDVLTMDRDFETGDAVYRVFRQPETQLASPKEQPDNG